jgi:hypothetical protein
MLKQIRSLVQTSISIFFSDINYIDKKIDQIILEQVPCLRNFMKKMTAILWKNDTKSFIFPKLKMISIQNFEDNTSVVHVLLDVMFFCRHKKWWPKWPSFHISTKRCKRWFICYNCTQNKYFYTQFLLLWCQISYFLTKLWHEIGTVSQQLYGKMTQKASYFLN